MGAYSKVLKVGVAAASVNSVSLTQSLAAAGPLLLNGTTKGIFTYATQLLFTFAGNETGHSFIVTGTLSNGQTTTETVAGNNGSTANSVNNFLTVTSITGPITASTLQVGTNAVGESPTMIVDRFINPAIISVGAVVTGTISYTVEYSLDGWGASGYDLVNNVSTWWPVSALNAQTTSITTTIQGPVSMLKIVQLSGTGLVTTSILTPMGNIG